MPPASSRFTRQLGAFWLDGSVLVRGGLQPHDEAVGGGTRPFSLPPRRGLAVCTFLFIRKMLACEVLCLK